MEHIKVSIDYNKWDRKPSRDNQFKDLTDRRGRPLSEVVILGATVGKHVKTLPIGEFARKIATNGQTWSPFVFNKCPISGKVRRRAELFQSCEVLGLDFDDNTSLGSIVERSAEHGLIPNIIHETFSSSPKCRKYRAIYMLDKTYTSSDLIRLQILTLLQWFPDADAAVKDLARLYFGSNSGVKFHNYNFRNTIEVPDDLVAEMDKKDLTYIPPDLSSIDSSLEVFNFDMDEDKYNEEYLKLSDEQRRFIRKKFEQAMVEIITHDSNISDKSRYELIFTWAEYLTGVKGITGAQIVERLTNYISQSEAFKTWSYNPYDVIVSAIRWKANTPNVRSGRLFDVNSLGK